MFNISTINNFLNKQIKKYILYRDNTYSKISKYPQLNCDKQKDNKQFNQKFNEYINKFISFINANQNIDSKLFYENLRTLIIKEKRNFNKLLFIKSCTTGRYNGYDNKILILREDNFYSIYHELLHCASRRVIREEMHVGFHKLVVDKKKLKTTLNIGKALNEGYTTLLEKRYFDSIEHTQKRGYAKEEFISSTLEQIVGKEEMEKLYFNADLDGLIERLKQFSSEEDIYLFLEYFDKILVNSKKKIKTKEAENIYKFIGKFLLKLHVYKVITLFKNDKINDDEFLNLIDDFIILLSSTYVIYKKNTYDFLTKDLADQILDKINEDLDNKQKNKIIC